MTTRLSKLVGPDLGYPMVRAFQPLWSVPTVYSEPASRVHGALDITDDEMGTVERLAARCAIEESSARSVLNARVATGILLRSYSH